MRKALLWLTGGLAAVALVAAVTVVTVRVVLSTMNGSPAAAGAPAEGAEGPRGQEVPLEKFVTNLKDPGTAVDVTLVLVVPGKKEAARVAAMESRLRSALIGMLRGLTSRDLAGPEGQALVAARALETANKVLGSGTVIEVLVTHMVTQP
ncbi:MAG: flagellar basal body-associated FliL family protein [Firmicutes bacterium]|nr:flagellar basal body-associated FliL family protein [Bacillota bacterium]